MEAGLYSHVVMIQHNTEVEEVHNSSKKKEITTFKNSQKDHNIGLILIKNNLMTREPKFYKRLFQLNI